jgi:hypothetical protein
MFKNKSTKPVDASPIFKEMERLHKVGTDEEKEKFAEAIEGAFTTVGKKLLDRAIRENVITIREYADWCNDYGMSESNMCPILEIYYLKKDGHEKKGDDTLLLTVPDSPIYKMKHILKEKLNI